MGTIINHNRADENSKAWDLQSIFSLISEKKMTENMELKKLLDKVMSENLEFNRLHNAMKRAEEDENKPPKVVVCGLLKAGKSSLLNAITGHLKDEFFTTNAARATIVVASKVVDGVEYIDTPGIDATDGDDDEAWKGLVSADVVLFVHNLRNGEMDTQELEFIAELQRRRPNLVNEIMVVFSNAESVPQNQSKVVEKLHNTLSSVVVECPSPFVTSFTTYKKGKNEDKPVLIKHSGIDEFRQDLLSRVNSGKHLNERKNHTKNILEMLIKEVESEISQRNNKIRIAESKDSISLNKLKKDLTIFNSVFVERIENYNQI